MRGSWSVSLLGFALAGEGLSHGLGAPGSAERALAVERVPGELGGERGLDLELTEGQRGLDLDLLAGHLPVDFCLRAARPHRTVDLERAREAAVRVHREREVRGPEPLALDGELERPAPRRVHALRRSRALLFL